MIERHLTGTAMISLDLFGKTITVYKHEQFHANCRLFTVCSKVQNMDVKVTSSLWKSRQNLSNRQFCDGAIFSEFADHHSAVTPE